MKRNQRLPRRRRSRISALALLGSLLAVPAIAADPVDYQRQVQPILADHCLACHGVDEATREGSLRLDDRAQALLGGDSGEPAIVPGKPDESELIRRIISDDEGELMPPPDHQQRLSQDDVATLRSWIEQGAEYQTHWAFTGPVKPQLPDTDQPHPVDALIRNRLQQQGLQPAPQADPDILCRRLYLDVIGLPPSPEQLSDFRRDGFEATLDKLLASDRFGEKWARHWLDAARYSDTNGYEKDLRRDQWIWRDWVIKSINNDLPYDQFLIEQVAGDLLPNATQDQIIATGFLRNSMINEEGAIVPEQFRMVEMFDRMDCVGKAILGLSTQCAQCHSHKYDPLTMDEYYGMFAYLNDTYEAQSWIYSPEQQSQIDKVQQGIASAESRLKEQVPDWAERLETWTAAQTERLVDWQPLEFHDLNSISGLNHPVQQPDGSIMMLGHTSADVYFIGKPVMSTVTGIRFEVLTHDDLPFGGPGRNAVGQWGVQELEVLVKATPDGTWEKAKLINATADFSEPDNKTDEGKKATGPVAYLIDGSNETQWKGDRGIGRRNAPGVAVAQFETPLELPEGSELKIAVRMGDMVGRCRVSLTTAPDPQALPFDYDAALALRTPPQERSEAENLAVFRAWRSQLEEAKGINDEIAQLWKQYPTAMTSVLHLEKRTPQQSRSTHRLARGAWDQPLDAVQPHVPQAFHELAETQEPPRLQFARWLASDQSPLTARVAVNRVWQHVFGVGLVETAEDFGTRAPTPEYQEVLDLLACQFMENGWSRKELLRTILTSKTYQQSSRATPEMLEADPRNQLLARGPRFRADAEVVRDIALTTAGVIHHKLGGPSVIPPVPQNVLDYNYTYPSYWKPAEGAERYRRAVYGFRKRSMPDPSMSSLDAPNGDASCARRVRSNTPLAALTILNETIFVEAARGLALRILAEGGGDDTARIDYAYILCTSRLPNDQERQVMLDLLASRRQKIADGWLDPRAITTGDPDKLPQLPPGTTPQDAAAWTIASRVLLNLDETITKN